MNLSLKQKAFFQTIGFFGSALAAGVLLSLIVEYVAISTILTAIGIGIVTYVFYIEYRINLSRLQYKEKLQEMVAQK